MLTWLGYGYTWFNGYVHQCYDYIVSLNGLKWYDDHVSYVNDYVCWTVECKMFCPCLNCMGMTCLWNMVWFWILDKTWCILSLNKFDQKINVLVRLGVFSKELRSLEGCLYSDRGYLPVSSSTRVEMCLLEWEISKQLQENTETPC